jgi:hypothetical protein
MSKRISKELGILNSNPIDNLSIDAENLFEWKLNLHGSVLGLNPGYLCRSQV